MIKQIKIDDFDTFFRLLSEEVAKILNDSPGCHDYDHTLRVVGNAGLLCDLMPAAKRHIALLGALLHDIARPEELASKGAKCHAKLGYTAAKELLLAHCLDEETAEAIACCVRTHRYRDGAHPESLEAQIVYDADKLDSLGATGIGRAFLFAGREGAKLHNTREAAQNSAAYSIEDTAYREYLVKLSKLPEAMQTVPGRKIAEERKKFMDDFFQQLNAECNLE